MLEGSCHCGAVAFEVDGTAETGLDCNCSFCRRRGALLAFYPAEAFRLTTDPAAPATYTFNRHVIRHHFCPTCGIGTHGEGTAPDGRAMVAVNLRCVPAVDLDAIPIRKVDGAGR